MSKVQVIGVKFVKSNCFGDFFWMCQQDEYVDDTLFIFNDNEEYHNTNKQGAGNAIMRRFNVHSNLAKPKSAGIPTGTMRLGGYIQLDEQTKKTIDKSIEEINQLIKLYKYKKIFFSAELDGKLGTSIFAVEPNVINYITAQIYNLSTEPVQIVRVLPNDYFNDSYCDENSSES